MWDGVYRAIVALFYQDDTRTSVAGISLYNKGFGVVRKNEDSQAAIVNIFSVFQMPFGASSQLKETLFFLQKFIERIGDLWRKKILTLEQE